MKNLLAFFFGALGIAASVFIEVSGFAHAFVTVFMLAILFFVGGVMLLVYGIINIFGDS